MKLLMLPLGLVGKLDDATISGFVQSYLGFVHVNYEFHFEIQTRMEDQPRKFLPHKSLHFPRLLRPLESLEQKHISRNYIHQNKPQCFQDLWQVCQKPSLENAHFDTITTLSKDGWRGERG